MFAAKRACIDNFLKLKTFTMRKNLFASDATVSTHLLNRKASGTLPKKVSFNDEEDQRYPSSPSDGLFSEILDKAKTFKIDIISTPSSMNSDVKGTGFHSVSFKIVRTLILCNLSCLDTIFMIFNLFISLESVECVRTMMNW